MNSLLIGINSKYIHPSLALYQLQANTNYKTEILEFTIKDKIEHIASTIIDQINLYGFNSIAFSCYLWNIEIVINIAKFIKQKFPTLATILGGPEVSYDAKYFMEKYSSIDYIISGEGEEAFNELLNFLNKKIKINEVSNLYFRDKNNILYTFTKVPDINNIKLATLNVKDYKNRYVYLESSRGCPYHCSYCTASLENKVRFFKLDTIKNILLILMKEKVKTVKFLDRTFNANQTYMTELLSFINDNNICTTFQFEIVGENLTPETISFINKLNSKFLRFEIGIQSTNNLVNLAVGRTQDFRKLKNNILLLNETKKVDIHTDLIAGLPYETLDSFRTSFDETFLLQCKELQLGFLKFLRGTKMMDLINEHEYIYMEKPPYEIISNKYMSSSDLQQIHKVEKSLNRYYNSGLFQETFEFLITNKLIPSYFNFFIDIYQDISHYQTYDLFIILDNYFKINFIDNYATLHFILICDYLKASKVRPKIWWDASLIDRTNIFPKLISNRPVTLEDLYRYSIVINYQNVYFVAVYKNYKPFFYKINLA